eukprot:scaffold488_cov372-Prasinococcus_capsulatus_cf.AAC.2
MLTDRVKPEEVRYVHDRQQDNTYFGTFGNSGWGAKAQQMVPCQDPQRVVDPMLGGVGQVRGKDFRHEKTKKKRGSYRGGLIDSAGVNSFKFED